MATVDFFTYQDKARKRTALLVFCYVLAVILIILAIYFVFVIAGLFVERSPYSEEKAINTLWNLQLFFWVAFGVLVVVVSGTLYKTVQLAHGGETVARMLGGRPISKNTRDPDERKVLNVVEEMAIASGIPAPSVFVLDNEDSINAFAAGFSVKDAVIGVTRGAIKLLNRDELQGVIGHEFSHIFNGDMRLNIRLMGVLHGILLLALIGYTLLRTAPYGARTASRRRRNDGGAFFLLILGLALMVIGYIGVFFANIIKSAVSRQREFLADASAVQYTRNPSGLAGALKKIGGYASQSIIRNPRAQEASHLFFANTLSGAFMRLFATHPPLEERIRRLDPSFHPELAMTETEATTQRIPTSSTVSAVSAFATNNRISVQPNSIISSVGTITDAHLAYAAEVIRRIPSSLIEALSDPQRTQAVVYALLLSKDKNIREIQLATLTERTDASLSSILLNYKTLAQDLEPALKFPVLDIAISTLKELTRSQYNDFKQNILSLITADKQIDIFEYTLQRMIMRHLEPLFEKTPISVIRYRSLNAVVNPCVKLLSCLAYWGAESTENAVNAFRNAINTLMDDSDAFTILPRNECSLQSLDETLKILAEATPAIKKRVLEACVACIAYDGYVTVREAELIRAVADALECPVPPILPG